MPSCLIIRLHTVHRPENTLSYITYSCTVEYGASSVVPRSPAGDRRAADQPTAVSDEVMITTYFGGAVMRTVSPLELCTYVRPGRDGRSERARHYIQVTFVRKPSSPVCS